MPSIRLARKQRRTRILICCRNRIVDVYHDPWVGCLVGARQRGFEAVCRILAPVAAHVNLGTRDVELGATGSGCAMETYVLSAQEIESGRQTLRYRDGKAVLVC